MDAGSLAQLQHRSDARGLARLLLHLTAIAVTAAVYALALSHHAPLVRVTFWLLPVAIAQPILRAILLAEHMGCSNDDDPLESTRTTYTIWPVRMLMWEMPYHAEHHHYPALPFFALARAYERLGPRLAHVAHAGYSGFHASLLRALSRRSPPREAR